ncbi:MAG: holin-like protein [Glaciecola sp.]|jgi:holin-like protein
MMQNIVRGCLGFAVLISIFFLALFLFHYLALPLPPALIGIVILFFALLLCRRVPSFITIAARPLLVHMGLFLLPAMISLMLFLDVFSTYFIALMSAILFSTLLSLALTLWLSQRILYRVKASVIKSE